ncbi:hypothetical protein EHO66_00545 [Leptospira kmetyi]|uniref:hypothetical protein n=1 Tax=Leptospira kmetyi TaxID=408139 RepID=UPI001082663F|nr:hypothetical protein [Leptospira kmetyi]TGK34399.1 hypothetical protein EHO66_00545 [Leptospira kmetyi]
MIAISLLLFSLIILWGMYLTEYSRTNKVDVQLDTKSLLFSIIAGCIFYLLNDFIPTFNKRVRKREYINRSIKQMLGFSRRFVHSVLLAMNPNLKLPWHETSFAHEFRQMIEDNGDNIVLDDLPFYFKELGESERNWYDYLAVYVKFLESFIIEMIAYYTDDLTADEYSVIMSIRESAIYSNREFHFSKLKTKNKSFGRFILEVIWLMQNLENLERTTK